MASTKSDRKYVMTSGVMERSYRSEIPSMSFSLSTSCHSIYQRVRCLSFNDVLKLCTSLKDLKCLHAQIVTRGCSVAHWFFPLATKLVSFAAFLGPAMDYARCLFDILPHKNTSAWNPLIRGYAIFGPCHEALHLYHDMRHYGLFPDQFTFPFIVRTCSVLSALREGKKVHCDIVKIGFSTDFYVQTALVSMYAQNEEIYGAEFIFKQMIVRNVVSWTAMIAGYTQNGYHGEALSVFKSMVCSGLRPNSITCICILPSCGWLRLLRSGESVHGYAIKLGLDSHLNLLNALIAMYGNCGKVEFAWDLFDEMKAKNLASWNAMIAAYEHNGSYNLAIEIFHQMFHGGVEANRITLITIISVCAKSGNLEIGRWVHNVVRDLGLEANTSIINALLDMYAKCGDTDLARDLFDKFPQRDVASWSVMIGAYAVLGRSKDALDLFSKMKRKGFRPNSFTFTSVLLACSDVKLVDEAKRHFDSMRLDYLITPKTEHYTCMVDLLGRAGRLDEAFEFIQNMPINPDVGTWGALLSACRVHGNLELADVIATHLFSLDHSSASYYVLLSNIYAEAGRWESVERLRKLMKQREVNKVPGYSILDKENKSTSCYNLSTQGKWKRNILVGEKLALNTWA